MYVTYKHIDIKFTVHLPLTNNHQNDNSRGTNHYTGMYARRKMQVIMMHRRMQGNSEKVFGSQLSTLLANHNETKR